MSTSTKTTTTTTTPPHYRIVDIHSYLSSVEDELRSFGSNLRLNVKPHHVKSMIRTLLDIPHKVTFDEMLRNKRYEMERHKLIQFITTVLLPALIAMDNDDDDDYKDDDDDNETAPSSSPPPFSSEEFSPSALRRKCQSILSSSLLIPPSSPRFKRSLFRIASGPRYRGDMMAFVRDVVPHSPNAVRFFETAAKVVTEREALMCLIEEGIVGVDEVRREMALRCVNGEWYPDDDGDTTTNNNSNNNGKSAGLQCEDECIKYLNKRVSLVGNGSSVVYRNVFLRRHSTSKPITFINEEDDSTTATQRGFISTTAIDDGQCSEFDAAVVKMTTTTIEDDDGRRLSTTDDCHCHYYVGEIWEAKATLSPSSLFDATRKKIAALDKIITDESSVFLHRDGTAVIGRRRLRRRRSGAMMNGESTSSSQSSSLLPHLIFGIFGNEILSPTAAARQLAALSCHETSLGDVDMVMMAVERGYFEIDADVAIERLVSYRRSLLEIADGNLDVMVVVIDDDEQQQ